MLPVEILISEHRLIEQMVKLLEKEMKRIVDSGKVDSNFIVVAVDFLRTYADRYHHGKEEGILFKGLSSKKLSDNDQKIMLELVMEHALARKTVKSLESLKEDYVAGKTKTHAGIISLMKTLIDLYPKHIQKEDELFFYPSMKYFSTQEHKKMLDDFIEFDQNFTNKHYKQLIEALNS